MKKLTTEEFIDRANAVHGVGRYDYSKSVYSSAKEKIVIKCNTCGSEFLQSPSSHLISKTCCPRCLKIKRGNFRRFTKEEFVKKSKLKHGNKYNYNKSNYINNTTKVLIHCNVCGNDFYQSPAHHILESGCPLCALKNRSKSQLKSLEKFVFQACKIHGNRYNYSNVKYKGNSVKVEIYCNNCKSFFYQTPRDHLSHRGCPRCACSHGENFILDLLNKNKIKHQMQKTFIDCKSKLRLPFDFYLPEFNLVIEFDGIQHYKPVSVFDGDAGLKATQYRDNIKTNYCYDNDIILCRIRYDEDIYNVLSEYLELREK